MYPKRILNKLLTQIEKYYGKLFGKVVYHRFSYYTRRYKKNYCKLKISMKTLLYKINIFAERF